MDGSAVQLDTMDPDQRIHWLIKKSEERITFDINTPIKRYFRSGKELLKMAKVYRDEGDEERAFQLYMRYITLFVEVVPKHPEYKTSDANERKFARQKCKEALSVTEQLKDNLKSRYEDQYHAHLEQMKAKKQAEERLRQEQERLKQEEMQLQLQQKQLDQSFENDQITIRLQEARDRISAHITAERERKSPATLAPSSHHPTLTPSNSFETANHGAMVQSDHSVPAVDRSTKPSAPPDERRFDGLRTIVLPSNTASSFLQRVQANTDRNVETCGILAGKLSQNCFTITHILIPDQTGTSDSCQTSNEEKIFDYQDEHDLMTLGWIHTHPSQSAFMSSIDLHTHCSYQLMLNEAIAIVCAPKFDQVGLFSLTPNYGLQFIANCTLSGFHPHPKEPPLYTESDHVRFDHQRQVNVVDLRLK